MNKTKCDVFYEGDNCWVIGNAMDFVGRTGKYVLWVDGNNKSLFNVWTKYKSCISEGHDVYFMLKNVGIFKNHVELVEGTTDLYFYKQTQL